MTTLAAGDQPLAQPRPAKSGGEVAPAASVDIVPLLELPRYADPATRRLWRAVCLAPTIEICEALLRDQDVPRSSLDPVWRKRFGL